MTQAAADLVNDYKDAWWTAEVGSADVHMDVMERAQSLEMDASNLREDNLLYYRLYSGRAIPNVYGLSMTGVDAALDLTTFQAPWFNMVRMSVDTLMSKVGRNRPWILFQTDGGNHKSRFLGKKCTAYVDGLFDELHVYRHGRAAIRNACITGTGFIKVTSTGRKIEICSVLPDELMVDAAESVYGNPRTLYHRRFVARGKLIAQALKIKDPKQRDIVLAAIKNAHKAKPGVWSLPMTTFGDMIPVVEAWRLPDEEGADGRHVLVVEGATMHDEPWKRSRFPFAVIRYNEPHSGWWGQGIGEILLPIQARHDIVDSVIREAQGRVGRPWMSAPKSANGSTGMSISKLIGPGIANVVEHMPGSPPQVLTFPSVAPDIYNERKELRELGFQSVGISQMTAQGLQNVGLGASGEARRAAHDFESERFVTLAQQIEEFYADVATLVLEEAQYCKPRALAVINGSLAKINWGEVANDIAEAKPRPFPLSSLPTSPAGRLARADEMLARGQITKEQHARIIDYPDTQAELDLMNAPREAIEKVLDLMVEKGDDGYRPPEPGMDIDLCVTIGTLRFNRELVLGTPEDRLDLIGRFIQEAQALQVRMKARQAAQQQAAQPPQPPAPSGNGTLGGEQQTTNPAVPSEAPAVPASAMQVA